ncbi:unnamed protein product [Paramecium pentaurelia]|uniref:Fatty acid hydroxylase domain-containing protein n=1 Tax=Paramecium pentaurelia TaxID=43138 RepID=A0A8S1XVA4_9CILI|nr:unnamed protein product [Paramecium pentaurelia]
MEFSLIKTCSITGLFLYFLIGKLCLMCVWPTKIEEKQFFFVISLYVVHLITYIIVNAFYFICYESKSKYISQAKIEQKPWPWDGKDSKVWNQMKSLFWKNVFINQFIMIGVAYGSSCIKLDTRFDQSFPTVFEISWQILVFGVIEDVLFYFSHRLLHTPYFYGKVHKVHHIYNITVSWSAEFAHPLEYILGNLIPVIAGPILLGSQTHMITILVFVGLATHKTLSDHSGFNFVWDVYQYLPLTTHSEFHSKHHSLNTGNYSSTFTYLDDLLGTTIKK